MVKLSKKTLVTVGAAGVLALGIAVPTAAMAADRDTGSSSAQQGRQEHQQQFAAALAKELGVDEAKVTAALEKVRTQLHPDGKSGEKKNGSADRTAQLKERLAAAVKEGKLTQAEADAISKAAEAGVLGGHTRGSDRNSSGRSGE
ncbi:hypothetical protein [Catellatospora bangladeshensis]|uniref:Uncharacterized protein n=1 Tax=Catellatospora bangladeshensis TaxID=310355 RepID=A0A8J3JSS8_9ACTN|nr:hypothetical protein [Catellatospora bangladeshensis]GIF86257.1 hypothetical protein Cba03nite_76060 [Catellatospora bangladeshensis]